MYFGCRWGFSILLARSSNSPNAKQDPELAGIRGGSNKQCKWQVPEEFIRSSPWTQRRNSAVTASMGMAGRAGRRQHAGSGIWIYTLEATRAIGCKCNQTPECLGLLVWACVPLACWVWLEIFYCIKHVEYSPRNDSLARHIYLFGEVKWRLVVAGASTGAQQHQLRTEKEMKWNERMYAGANLSVLLSFVFFLLIPNLKQCQCRSCCNKFFGNKKSS
jgi:hypothetical protein